MAEISELDDLYREVIVDHYRRPRNTGTLPDPDVESEGKNPICGDEIAVQIAFDGDRVGAIRFRGRGCSISQASASMMTEAVLDQPIERLPALIADVEGLLRGEAREDEDLGDLDALQGVSRFPVRVKCALLSWKVLRQALDKRAQDGSTS